MPGLQDEEADSEKIERLKSSLWHAVGGIVDAISLEQDINTTPQFIGALTELVWSQIYNSGRDLEAFTKHAGRSTVDTRDVMLLVRRNEGLQQLLQNCLSEIESKKQ